VLEKAQSPGPASLAWALVARSLLAAGKPGKLSPARTAAERALSLAQQSTDHIARIQAGLAQAEVEIQAGKSADAERHLNALYNQVKQTGYGALEFRVRLLQAQAEQRSGKQAAARVSLNKLQTEAHTKGFLLLARQASSLLLLPSRP